MYLDTNLSSENTFTQILNNSNLYVPIYRLQWYDIISCTWAYVGHWLLLYNIRFRKNCSGRQAVEGHLDHL